MPAPDTLQQLDPLRQEPEHRMTGFAQRIRRIAPRPVNRLPAKTVARLRAVFCLRATIETGAKHHTQEHDSQAFNARISRRLERQRKTVGLIHLLSILGLGFQFLRKLIE